MGRESRVRKDRTCRHCGKQLFAMPERLKKHAGLCARATRSGLVLPEAVERPTPQLVDPRGNKL